MKYLVIMGSSRSNGDTARMVREVIGKHKIEVVDLLKYNISIYDYEHKNSGDDFAGIAKKITKSDVIIFATPVYWYAMSAPLKIFFDRFTDLITIRKDLGRAFKGRKCYLLSCGSDVDIPPGFEEPFSATCSYLNMEYRGFFYYYTGKDRNIAGKYPELAAQFGDKLFAG